MIKQKFILYGRFECHLCQDMQNDLLPLQKELDFELTLIDVDEKPEWVARYGSRVPVLVGDKGEVCHYFLDKQALLQYF